MRPVKSQAWLEALLANAPEPADVLQLTKECPKEDLYLDYKSGSETTDSSKARETLREYAAAFANSEGGILLFGYKEPSSFDDARVPGGGPFTEWATRTLYDLTPYLQPPPRFHELDVVGKHVLILVVPRSSTLVPLRTRGRVIHYLRIGDSLYPPKNFEGPDYLMSDLLLGRRERPLLQPTIKACSLMKTFHEGGDDLWFKDLSLQVVVENEGWNTAEDVRLGAIAYVPEKRLASMQGRFSEPSRSMHAAVEEALPAAATLRPLPTMRCVHLPNSTQANYEEKNLRPFEAFEGRFGAPVPVFLDQQESMRRIDVSGVQQEFRQEQEAAQSGAVQWLAALYVLARDMAPSWYQLRICYGAVSIRTLEGEIFGSQELAPPLGWRPEVGYRFLKA